MKAPFCDKPGAYPRPSSCGACLACEADFERVASAKPGAAAAGSSIVLSRAQASLARQAPGLALKKKSTALGISIKNLRPKRMFCYDLSNFQDVVYGFLGFDILRFLECDLRRKPDWIW